MGQHSIYSGQIGDPTRGQGRIAYHLCGGRPKARADTLVRLSVSEIVCLHWIARGRMIGEIELLKCLARQDVEMLLRLAQKALNVGRVPSPGSGAWRYLCWARWIPVAIVRRAIQQGVLRQGRFGSMWTAHTDGGGAVVGWEERGPEWRGFSTGGSTTLFRLGQSDAPRLCVTEAAINAMSPAALEGPREHTLYLSTGGGWSPATDAALSKLTARPEIDLVAATDANSQGDAYDERLRIIAERRLQLAASAASYGGLE